MGVRANQIRFDKNIEELKSRIAKLELRVLELEQKDKNTCLGGSGLDITRINFEEFDA